MANMSYCRFQNTLQDLLDCEAHLYDRLDCGDKNDKAERRARRKLVALCGAIVCMTDDQPLPEDK